MKAQEEKACARKMTRWRMQSRNFCSRRQSAYGGQASQADQSRYGACVVAAQSVRALVCDGLMQNIEDDALRDSMQWLFLFCRGGASIRVHRPALADLPASGCSWSYNPADHITVTSTSIFQRQGPFGGGSGQIRCVGRGALMRCVSKHNRS